MWKSFCVANPAVALCDLSANESVCDDSLADMSLLQLGFQAAQTQHLNASFGNHAHAASSHGVQILDKFGIIFWMGFLIAAVAYSLMSGTEAAPRDGRWDSVRFWCMVMVLWSHITGFMGIPRAPLERNPGGDDEWQHFPHAFVSRFMMTAFSLVSGIFASGLVTIEEDKASINFRKLKNSLRDLVLVELTILPVRVLSPLTHASPPVWSPVTQTPLFTFGGRLWYLDALFLWQLLTPLICIMGKPVLMAGIVAAFGRGQGFDGFFFYFPFFVFGFVLGGGMASGEERAVARTRFEERLTDGNTRFAACCFLTIWAAGSTVEMPEPFMMVFNMQADLNRGVTPWSLGGWCTDFARIAFGLVVTLAFIVIVFMLPPCELLSSAGSRTLYAYVLQPTVLENPSLRALVQAVPEPWNYLANFAMAFLFTLLLGSRLMTTLTHHFVQPQWLVDLCTIQPSSSALKG
jgi:hypothetical protein